MVDKRLTLKVRELVAPDRNARPTAEHLTEAQVDLLSAVARRQDDFAEPVSPPRAITALATGAPPDTAIPILDAVLADHQAPQPDRVSAARGLGRVATPQAEAALLEHLRDRDARVQQDVLAALGTFAGPEAAQQLKNLSVPSDAATRQQLVFTEALIAYRHDLDGPFLPEVAGKDRRPGRPDQMTTVRMDTRSAAATAADLKKLRGLTYGVRFGERAFALKCGPTDWTIFLNEQLGPSLTGLFDRQWIVGILAQRLPTREALISRYVLVARPLEDAVNLNVVRADGATVYTGKARRADAAIGFAIADVGRPGTAPANVEGRITSTGVTLDVVIAFATRTEPRKTSPLSGDAK